MQCIVRFHAINLVISSKNKKFNWSLERLQLPTTVKFSNVRLDWQSCIFVHSQLNNDKILSLSRVHRRANVVWVILVSNGKPQISIPRIPETIVITSSASPIIQSYITLRRLGWVYWWNITTLQLFVLPILSNSRTARMERHRTVGMAQNACSDVRTCLLGVWLIPDQIWGRGRSKP